MKNDNNNYPNVYKPKHISRNQKIWEKEKQCDFELINFNLIPNRELTNEFVQKRKKGNKIDNG